MRPGALCAMTAAAVAFVGLSLAGLAGCVGTRTEAFTRSGIAAICAQDPLYRQVERVKAAQLGLWVQCVPPGTMYEALELRPVARASP